MLRKVVYVTTLCGVATWSHGSVSLLTQDRSISAATSFDANVVTRSALDFLPFVASVRSATDFPTVEGGIAANVAESTINCIVDPNAIRAFGALTASGGIGVVGGAPAPVFGEAAAFVSVTFEVLVDTPFTLFVSPRPSFNPDDEFEVELSALEGGSDLVEFRVDEQDPAQVINRSGILTPGRYSITYAVELTGDAAQVANEFTFDFTIPTPGSMTALMGLFALSRRRR